MQDIRPYYDKGDLTILVLIDFSKAFDSVDHKILIEKLYKIFGFSVNACKLLKSYLEVRSHFVALNNKSSNMKYSNSGIPQGSILGPVLFTMFINDIVLCCNSSYFHIYFIWYANLSVSIFSIIEDWIFRRNEDLPTISEWSKANRLSINVSKTQAICLHHKVYAMDIPVLTINQDNISFTTEVKNLGFIINYQLNCISHMNNTKSTSFFASFGTSHHSFSLIWNSD